MHESRSFCRICSGGCGVIATIENDRIVKMRGDPDNPMSSGYACFKGLQAPDSHHGRSRLLHPLKRGPDETWAKLCSQQALDEIGERLRSILDRDGPEAIGLYCGNGSMASYAAFAMQRGFATALGANQRFTTFTIDQSAKFVAFERMGGWAGGSEQLETSDVAILFGSNPLVSHTALGLLCVDPVKRLKDAQARGMKLIVIDPRLTETARQADVFLQPLPGQDTVIAGAMLRMILVENWHDSDFCKKFVGSEGMCALRVAVDPFTPEMAEARAGLLPGDIRRAAKMFACDSARGKAITATGPNLSPHSNVSQHLVECLNVICGRFPRAGDKAVAIDVLDPPAELRAEVIPAPRSWQAVAPSRIRGVGELYGERLTGTLADEILTPGKGQIRALIVSGGNPANSIPDQLKITKALKSLELLVVVDPFMTVTAEMADYVLPPTLMYERADLPLSIAGMAFWPVAWSQYAAPLVPPPADSDLVEDWYALWAIAKQLGKQIRFDGAVDLDMETPPTAEELIAIRARRSTVPLDEIKRYPSGKIYDLGGITVKPAGTGADAKFDVMPDDVAAELAAAIADTSVKGFTHVIASRRMRDLFNSAGYYLELTRRRNPFNPAGINPSDMSMLGLADDDEIEVSSDNGSVRAIAKSDPSLRPGVITLSHGWGGLPDKKSDPRVIGTSINPLISDNRNVEAVNAMPRMSAVPVNIRKV